MRFKCIEQNGECSFKEKFGENYYCGLPHKPNHKFIQLSNGHIQMDMEHCDDRILCKHEWQCINSNDYAEDTYRCKKCGKTVSHEGDRFI